jgi:hypothetical protein
MLIKLLQRIVALFININLNLGVKMAVLKEYIPNLNIDKGL